MQESRQRRETTPLSPAVCQELDINELTEFVKDTGAVGEVWWGDHQETTIRVITTEDGEANRAPALKLEYEVKDLTGHSEPEQNRVELEYTECNFGGVKPWFRCPGDQGACGRRTRKLYRPPRAETFCCRECHGVGYASAEKLSDHRRIAELHYRQVYERIDSENRRPHPDEHGPVPPERPESMDPERYYELVENLEDAFREYDTVRMTRQEQVGGPLQVRRLQEQ